MRSSRITLNLPPGLIAGLKRQAESNRRTVSGELTVLLEQGLTIPAEGTGAAPFRKYAQGPAEGTGAAPFRKYAQGGAV